MDFQQSFQSKPSSYKRKNKEKENERDKQSPRFWTSSEEEALIQCMLEEFKDGVKWKAENGFKPGFYRAVEILLKKRLPGTTIRASPNIKSKVKNWKKKYGLLANIKRFSGFNWNHDNNSIIVDAPDVWNEYVKFHSNANGMNEKTFPMFSSWQIFFGNDNATEELAEDPQDIEEVESEKEIDQSGMGPKLRKRAPRIKRTAQPSPSLTDKRKKRRSALHDEAEEPISTPHVQTVVSPPSRCHSSDSSFKTSDSLSDFSFESFLETYQALISDTVSTSEAAILAKMVGEAPSPHPSQSSTFSPKPSTGIKTEEEVFGESPPTSSPLTAGGAPPAPSPHSSPPHLYHTLYYEKLYPLIKSLGHNQPQPNPGGGPEALAGREEASSVAPPVFPEETGPILGGAEVEGEEGSHGPLDPPLPPHSEPHRQEEVGEKGESATDGGAGAAPEASDPYSSSYPIPPLDISGSEFEDVLTPFYEQLCRAIRSAFRQLRRNLPRSKFVVDMRKALAAANERTKKAVRQADEVTALLDTEREKGKAAADALDARGRELSALRQAFQRQPLESEAAARAKDGEIRALREELARTKGEWEAHLARRTQAELANRAFVAKIKAAAASSAWYREDRVRALGELNYSWMYFHGVHNLWSSYKILGGAEADRLKPIDQWQYSTNFVRQYFPDYDHTVCRRERDAWYARVKRAADPSNLPEFTYDPDNPAC